MSANGERRLRTTLILEALLSGKRHVKQTSRNSVEAMAMLTRMVNTQMGVLLSGSQCHLLEAFRDARSSARECSFAFRRRNHCRSLGQDAWQVGELHQL